MKEIVFLLQHSYEIGRRGNPIRAYHRESEEEDKRKVTRLPFAKIRCQRERRKGGRD